MKKTLLLVILSVFCSTNAVLADSWDDFSNLDRIWDGQKSITNQEFEKVMDKLEEKTKQKEEKQIKKKRKKMFGGGSTLHVELNPDSEIQELDILKASKEEGLLLNTPVQLVVGKNVLEKGFYKIFPERDENSKKVYIKFYQSQFFKGQVEMTETEDDYGKEVIDFVEVLPFNDSFVKVIFGSVDFNAFTFLPYINEQ